jgi:hypothetical protein
MFGKHRRTYRLIVTPSLLVLICACSHPRTANEQFTKRMQETRSVSAPSFTYMSDNAMLHDMSLADINFVPHSSELSGTGTARLDRMAYLLNAYGGTVRYETTATDEALVEQRLEHVREYLALVGCSMERVEVKAMQSGGRGLPADEAIEIKEKGTRPDNGGGSGGGARLGALGRGQ